MIVASNIEFIRGGKPLLENASATINPKQKVGLVGANGCGKSSFFTLLKQQHQVDAGELTIPHHWRLASVAQETPALDMNALQYVIDGDHEFRALQAKLKQAEEVDDGTKIAEMHILLDNAGGYTIESRAAELLAGLGFSEQAQGRPVSDFSGGWRMRLNLAQALLCPSDLLLLDEPTNHLDLDAVIWLEKWLHQYQGTLILISHDRDFIDSIVDKIIHIEQNKLFEYTGNYTSFERQRAEKLVQQQSSYEKQQAQMDHMQSYIDRFRYKANKAKQAQSRIKALEKMEQILPAHVDNQFSFSFREPEALPMPLLTLDQVSAGYDDLLILDKIELNLVPGSRIGLLGRNGAGKSTLIKLLSNQMKPKSGKLEINTNAKVGYFAQHQLEFLHLDESPMQHLARLAPDEKELPLRNFLGSFGFQGDKAFDLVAPFSGGEKARLVLALLVWQKPNLLLLDEPTNHLDLEMRHALTVALQAFEGAMVVVSHDRHLLRTTIDDLYLVHDKKVQPFSGDLDDYHQWLSDQQRIEKQAEQSADKAVSVSANRKDQKRLEAEFRKKLTPFKKQLNTAEKAMDSASARLTEIEQQLSESELYEQENKKKLTDLLKEQGEVKDLLEENEMLWMDVQEQIETLQSEFEG
ncbi:ABC transporter ATP-binding protein [Psychromonas sp. 14N.309.X.WAT.B.A12]|uniref:ABC transporter ATP-binding protein n=1 Tax=Psychromonas sp. 14N.309.X.WAT.B.A12 TaxID=2998322 RepID=UPI0025B18A73|nr:ABC transporter ATP-binding protein [Psychromonas sp. 14N.309.X.WAT.B.A12]MDN2664548.1 ABC transporter ATP-binding protein [Psychromonas sp. 14N.309.X.WAT.B.A12]